MFPAILILLGLGVAFGQDESPLLKEIVLKTQAGSFSLSKDGIDSGGVRYVPLRYVRNDEVCDVLLEFGDRIQNLSLIGSADFDIVDSLVATNPSEYSFKIRFSDLAESGLLKIRLLARKDTVRQILDIPLLPVTRTRVALDTAGLELFAGQEKTIEVVGNNLDNILPSPEWNQVDGFQYRLTETDDRLLLHVYPTSMGPREFAIPLQLRNPDLQDGRLMPRMVLLSGRFVFRKASLPYLRIEPQTVVMDERITHDGFEVQLDYDRSLQTGRKYLLEESQASGGPALSELFVKERMANNRMLCLLRAFNPHRRTSGSLFLKDGDLAKAVTNLDLLPKVRIDKMKVMRNGKDWEEGTYVHPGETVHLRLEGQSLDQAKFGFGELLHTPDVRDQATENVFECKLQIPLGISRSAIPVLDHDRPTGRTLDVKEFGKAHPFDFVSVDYGSGYRNIAAITGPEFFDRPIRDVRIRFDASRLDSEAVLFGKQYLKIDVKVTGPGGNLLDMTTISDVVVCPDANSKRFQYYDRSDCQGDAINLNEKLPIVNTYDLEGWSRITLVFSDASGHYDANQSPRKIDIYRQKRNIFDMDVSFPVGLLVHKFDDPGWGGFSGVSMAMMAKFGFFEDGAINRREPYELAAGFIAMDAFDLSKTATDRDLAVVALFTLNPMNPNRRLTFPFYLGGGYLLAGREWFWLLGPGISVQF